MTDRGAGRFLPLALSSGVFFVSAATLMNEILLTRIFSVTMWYHFAFMAISVAMFGATVGAILVYMSPGIFSLDRARSAITWSTLLFAVSLAATFALYVSSTAALSAMDRLPSALIAFTIVSIPFVFGGMTICLALTKFGRAASLYASDLIGAAAGSAGVVAVLALVDAITAVISVSLLAALAAVAFAVASGKRHLVAATTIVAILFGVLASVSVVAARGGKPLLRLRAVKGQKEGPALYEKWNSFSRIRVEGDPSMPRKPFGWGLSPAYRPRPVRELSISIDAASGTVLTRFEGDFDAVEHLRYDVSNIAHWLRPDANVLVIGTGGGRDVLSALAFRQPRVTGVEINGAILDAANGVFGEFTGHLDRRPGVTFINDEARSYLQRTAARHDIIQVTLIDTWAATAIGAFALTENSLYTVEAWNLFLDRLTERGVLSFSRWHRPEAPTELYRLVSLASSTLRRRGVADPRRHLLLVRARSADVGRVVDVATLLVSPTPFRPEDVSRLEQVAASMRFGVMLTPRQASDPVIATLASSGQEEAVRTFPADISAPSDDRPFFFNVMRATDVVSRVRRGLAVPTSAARTLLVLGAAIGSLTLATIIVPLRLRAGRLRPGSLPLIAFFAAIGFGFMFVEVAQMQRLSLYLGHPTYALAVALPALLLASGIGSYSVRDERTRGTLRILLLVTVMAVVGLITVPVLTATSGAGTWPRILVGIGVLAIPGLLMGMAFPLGVRRARGAEQLLPWLWGINGAASVCATVVAMIASTTFGISVTFWAGAASYAVALLSYVLAAPAAFD